MQPMSRRFRIAVKPKPAGFTAYLQFQKIGKK
jgi:hypothetical protein